MCAVANSDFCSATPATIDCDQRAPGAKVDVCGVGLPSPQLSGEILELQRSNNVEEFAGSGAVDLSCYSPENYPAAPGTPQMATVKGIAKIFSHGCNSKDLSIEIYTVKRTGGADDGEPDQLVGTAVTTPADCTDIGVLEDDHDECGDRWECTYEYANVPTETELLIKTGGALWAPLYEYGLYVPNSELAADGSYEKDVRALDKGDYTALPQVAMGKQISPGNGAIGGEIHDCGDVRLTNAVIDIDQPKFLVTYFTDNEDTPLPDPSKKVSSTLSIYSAMDVPPGPVTIAAAGVIDGKLVTAGHMKARVFADAVTSVTFRGLRGFQVP
jgi:hypothetical protein